MAEVFESKSITQQQYAAEHMANAENKFVAGDLIRY
jgi:hypothetical protein